MRIKGRLRHLGFFGNRVDAGTFKTALQEYLSGSFQHIGHFTFPHGDHLIPKRDIECTAQPV